MRRLATLDNSDMFYCLFLFFHFFWSFFFSFLYPTNSFLFNTRFWDRICKAFVQNIEWLNFKYSFCRLIRTLDSSDPLIYKVKWLYAHWLSSHGTFSFFYRCFRFFFKYITLRLLSRVVHVSKWTYALEQVIGCVDRALSFSLVKNGWYGH